MIATHRQNGFAIILLLLFAVPARAAWLPDGNPISQAPGDQRVPFMASARGSGGCGIELIVWEDARDVVASGSDLYCAFASAVGGTSMGDGEALCTASGSQSSPYAAFTGVKWCGPNPPPLLRGAFIVAWQDGRSGSAKDIYAQRVPLGSFASWAQDGVPVCLADGDQTEPHVVGTDEQTAATLVAWVDGRGANTDLYLQKLDWEGVPQLANDGILLCAAQGPQDQLRMVPDGGDGALLAWRDGRDGGAGSIFALRILADGTLAPGWPSDGVRVCDDVSGQESPVLVGDGQGGAVVAWQDHRNGPDGDVFAMRLTGAGARATGWPATGLSICSATGEQVPADIVALSSGGAVVVWEDGRNVQAGQESPDVDIYALGISGDGNVVPGWIAGGTRVGGSPYLDEHPRATRESGNLIVAWSSRSASNLPADIVAHALDSGGAVPFYWPQEPVIVCAAAGEQSVPVGAGDTAGMLVAWEDARDAAVTGHDIYVQWVNGSGVAGPVGVFPSTPPRSFRLSTPHPNPAADRLRFTIELSEPLAVSAAIVDVTGRRLATLAGGKVLEAGRHPLAWDCRDSAGRPTPAGVYFLVVSAGEERASLRFVHAR